MSGHKFSLTTAIEILQIAGLETHIDYCIEYDITVFMEKSIFPVNHYIVCGHSLVKFMKVGPSYNVNYEVYVIPEFKV